MPFRSLISLIILSSLHLFHILASDHCCSLSRPQLEQLALNSTTTPQCPADDVIERLPLWCELCQPPFCRVGNKCMCPSHFLNTTSIHEECTRSFLVPWPDSVGQEDIFRRICRADLETISTNNTSCCSLTEQQLIDQRSTHVACPRRHPFTIIDKCHPCPPGTCRLGSECYCPRDFLDRHSHECEETFGESWPLSLGKIDPDLQQCEDRDDQYPLPTLTPDFTLSSESCCSIPETEINATLDSYSENCPSHAFVETLDAACGTCPPDTCRVNKQCVCPQYFHQTGLLQIACTSSFGTRWPASIGKEDTDRRNCNLGTSSCCSLREDVLNDQLGLNNDCPSNSSFPLADKCNSTCPPGTCRVKDECFCVEEFKERKTGQCVEDFGVPWPSSVGREDMSLTACKNMTETSSSPTPSVSSPENSEPAPDSLASPSENSSTNEVGGGASNSRLSGVEIAGTAAGVVSALIALVVSAAGFFKWKQKQRARSREESFPIDDLE